MHCAHACDAGFALLPEPCVSYFPVNETTNREIEMDFLKPVRNWNRVRNTRNELNGLTNRELADLGITRGDIPFIARRSVR